MQTVAPQYVQVSIDPSVRLRITPGLFKHCMQVLVDLSLGMVERLIEAVDGGARVVEQCGGIDALENLVFQVAPRNTKDHHMMPQCTFDPESWIAETRHKPSSLP